MLAHFSCLDELVQVIYQGVYRFVVLSNVDEDKWTVHLGLSGTDGRWWRGSWLETDILHIVGSKSSDKLLETFSEKIAETFVRGELCIGDWSVEKGTQIKLTVGPSSKKPLHIPLVEISSAEAASYATHVFLDIAIQARSRECHLHPVQYPFASTLVASSPPESTKRTAHRPTEKHSAANIKTTAAIDITESDQKAQNEIKALKAELVKQKKRNMSPAEEAPSRKSIKICSNVYTDVQLPIESAPVSRPLKGASLANPNKKARKYQAIEFESDNE